ncbi:helix-turn-helix domain-containing protein [Streptomyces sp. JL4002]|uniref:MmyB family transcriptional regulator n=1 Tax=Streptomyces TaxID=1883 RepID=UPI0033F6A3B0
MRLSVSDRRRLKELLQQRRAAIDPVTAGFPLRTPGPGRRAAGLSQEQMDELLTRTRGTYNRFENGQLANAGGEFLTAVARTLGLDEQEWAFLWRLIRKENPPTPLHHGSGMSVAGVWQQAMDAIGGAIAYLHDAEWNVLAHNEEFPRLFPRGEAPSNIMRWMLLDPEARTRVLLHWETHWAPAVMPHLRHAAELRPGSAALARLERDVLDDPVAGGIYRAAACVPVPHVDGADLPIRHALHGPGRATTCLAEPVAAPGARIMLLFYTPDEAPGAAAS